MGLTGSTGFRRGSKNQTAIRLGGLGPLILVAVGLRLALLGVAVWNEPSVDSFLSQSDAGSFLRVANRIYGGSSFAAEAAGYHERVFLGWPLLFGWTRWLGDPVVGMVGLDLALCGLIPCLFAGLTGRRDLAWLLVFFPPAWLVYSTYPMSEAAFLALGLISVALLERAKPFGGGVAMGWMIAVRPHGLALLAGEMALLHRRRRELGWEVRIRYGVGLALGPALFLLINWGLYHDLFHQLHVYSKPLSELNLSSEQAASFKGGHWGPPFYWLLATPILSPVSPVKLGYIFAHVAVLVGLALLALRDWRQRGAGDLDLCMSVWFLVNSALIVSTGPYWGFHSFDRYFLWAWPAGLWILRERLHPRGLWLVGLLLSSLAVALYILLHKI